MLPNVDISHRASLVITSNAINNMWHHVRCIAGNKRLIVGVTSMNQHLISRFKCLTGSYTRLCNRLPAPVNPSRSMHFRKMY